MNTAETVRMPRGFREEPHNLQAELALLGRIMLDNAVYQRLAKLRPEHFYEPVHGRIFAAMQREIEAGRRVDHVLLGTEFDHDEALRDLDGAEYLARMARASETCLLDSVAEYARQVMELALRRAFITACTEAVNRAYDPACNEVDGAGQVALLREQLERIERAAPGSTSMPPLLSAEDFIDGYQANRALIKEWDMKRGWLYSLTAPTGGAKTAIALSEAVRLAMEGKRVVYLAGENSDDVRARVILMQQKLRLYPLPPTLRFVDRTFNLIECRDHVRREVENIGGADVIFVDTSPAFQVAAGGEEENNNNEQIKWAQCLRELTRLEGRPAVIALCHPTKRPQSVEDCVPRGGSAFLAEVDGNYASWLIAANDDMFFELRSIGKFRGSLEPITYRVERATCGRLSDEDGNPIRSVWAHRAEGPQIERASADQAEDEDAVLIVMKDYSGQSLAQIARTLGWRMRSGEPAKYRVQRIAKRLEKGGKLVKASGGRRGYELTSAGKKEAEKAADRIRREAK